MKLKVNDTQYEVDAQPEELLVWVIHEKIGLKNTRFGCGIEMCGACKVLVDGEVVKSCVLKVGDVRGKEIFTSEVIADIHDR